MRTILATFAGLVSSRGRLGPSCSRPPSQDDPGRTRRLPGDRTGAPRMRVGLHRGRWRDRWGYWHWVAATGIGDFPHGATVHWAWTMPSGLTWLFIAGCAVAAWVVGCGMGYRKA